MNKTVIDKNELYNKYIVENLTIPECVEYFKVGRKVIVGRLKDYGIKKDTSSRFKNIQKGIIKKFGVDYRKSFSDKQKKTMLERYGVEYTAQSPELLAKMQHTMAERYGKKNYVETSEFQSKSSQTCLKKYGVEWPCQFEQCIKALESASGHSKPEEEFANLLCNISYEQEFPIRGFMYDFKVKNVLFEINPSVTHNSTWGVFGKKPKDRMYHYTKYLVAKEYGYHCIHIFDWDDKSKIINLFLKKRETVYGRSCIIKDVSVCEASDFINKYHLQGYARDSVRLGLYFNGSLVSIMTFGKPRYNNKYQYELVRYCSNCNVLGGAEKLFKYFLKQYSPKSIVSYCDISKFNGEVYNKLGFSILCRNAPSKHWYNLKTGQHITDNLLRQRGFDQLFGTNYGKGKNNEEIMKKYGFVEVYDCGQITFAFKESIL